MLLEAVPNLSLGPHDAALAAVREALEDATSPGWALLDVHADADHGRTVLTLAGAPVPLQRALAVLVDSALEHGTVEGHTGVHPRVGLVDVVPLVALADARHADAARVAHAAAARLAARDVPVYWYGDLVPPPGQARLAALRRALRGPFEADAPLPEPPDLGPAQLHPRYGASCVGVRAPLVAYNVVLETTDLGVGRAVARAVRERDGGLPGVQALAFPLAHLDGRVQVSCNLTRIKEAGCRQAYEAIARAAREAGAAVKGAELVGLAPRAALGDAPAAAGLPAGTRALEEVLADQGLG